MCPLFFLSIFHLLKSGGTPVKKITDIVWELAEPAVQEQGCRIWDVEYVREAGQWYLRLYLDLSLIHILTLPTTPYV